MLGAAVVVAAASVVRPEVVGRRSLDGGHEGIIDVAPSPSTPACLCLVGWVGLGQKKRESEGPALMSKRQNHSLVIILFIPSGVRSAMSERTIFLWDRRLFQLSSVRFFSQVLRKNDTLLCALVCLPPRGFCEGMKMLRSFSR